MALPDLREPAARRRLYLNIALKCVHAGSGSGPETLWARTWRRPVFDLRTIVTLPFVVVGGVATRLYSPERMTDDLDVLPVVAMPYLVLMKMRASQDIDIGDLGRMPGAAEDKALNETREVIRWHLADGVEDLESLIYLGKLEYETALLHNSASMP